MKISDVIEKLTNIQNKYGDLQVIEDVDNYGDTFTDLIILNHASNVFGNVLPVKDIFEKSKKYNAITVLDVAQTAGVIDVDLQNLNVDFAYNDNDFNHLKIILDNIL